MFSGIEPLADQVRGLIEQIEADLRRDCPPTLTLNQHCNECEFRGACRGIAEARLDAGSGPDPSGPAGLGEPARGAGGA